MKRYWPSWVALMFAILLAGPLAFGFGILIDTGEVTGEDTSFLGKLRSKFYPKLGHAVHEGITEGAREEAQFNGQSFDEWFLSEDAWLIKDRQKVMDSADRNPKLSDYDQNTLLFDTRANLVMGVLYNDDPNGYLYGQTELHKNGFNMELFNFKGKEWGLKFVDAKRGHAAIVKAEEELREAEQELDRLEEEEREQGQVDNPKLEHKVVGQRAKVSKQLKELKELRAQWRRDYLYASHFGDLQYFHAMGTGSESRVMVKHKIMEKLDHDWDVAAGGKLDLIEGGLKAAQTARLGKEIAIAKECGGDEAVEGALDVYQDFPNYISEDAKKGIMADINALSFSPRGSESSAKSSLLAELEGGSVIRTESYCPNKISAKDEPGFLFRRRFSAKELFYHTSVKLFARMRALGSLLHTIQDSYAGGHVVREDHPADSGETSHSGRIVYFQDYGAQDGKKHGKYDNPNSEFGGDSAHHIPGYAQAKKRSQRIVEFFMARCDWVFENEASASSACRGEEEIFVPEGGSYTVAYVGVKQYLDRVVFPLKPTSEKSGWTNRSHPNMSSEKDSHTFESSDGCSPHQSAYNNCSQSEEPNK